MGGGVILMSPPSAKLPQAVVRVTAGAGWRGGRVTAFPSPPLRDGLFPSGVGAGSRFGGQVMRQGFLFWSTYSYKTPTKPNASLFSPGGEEEKANTP